MGGNYEKSLNNQLMEVMGRLDAVEKDLHIEKQEHKQDVARLNARINELSSENQLLRDNNERLKSIINNGECNVHIIRYLKKNSEESGNSQSGEMISLLCEMNHMKRQAISRGGGIPGRAGIGI